MSPLYGVLCKGHRTTITKIQQEESFMEQKTTKEDAREEIAKLAKKVEDEKVLTRVWLILERAYRKQA